MRRALQAAHAIATLAGVCWARRQHLEHADRLDQLRLRVLRLETDLDRLAAADPLGNLARIRRHPRVRLTPSERLDVYGKHVYGKQP